MDQVTGSGIADVTVTLTSETSDAVVEGTQTDANGAYAVNLTAGAAYTVSFSKEGYKGNQIAYTGADTTADTSGVDVQMEEKKEDTTFAFAMPAPDAVPYGTDFSNIAVSQEQPDVAVTYKSLDENVATVDADGNYTYTFTLENALGRDIQDEDMHISDAVDYRGVPYYMSQLNEFIRTFSYNFNKVQTSGYDLNDNAGQQMFIAKDKVNGIEMRFSDTVKTGFTFDSLLALDANGKIATDIEGYANTSYYMMTALNCSIDSQFAA